MAELSKSYRKDFDHLLAGPREWFKTLILPLTASQGDLKRGSLLTYDATTKKLKAITKKTDEVFGVLFEDIEDTEAEIEVLVYVSGAFNKDLIVVDKVTDSSTVDDYFLSARQNDIYLLKPQV